MKSRKLLLTLSLCMISTRGFTSQIDTIVFRGDSSQFRQRLCVYTPTDYDTARTYPMLYLLHGIHGNHYSWQRDGHLQQRMDSLIENQLVQPMVIVMPYCQRFDTIDSDEPRSTFHCLIHYPSIVRGEFEEYFFEIEDYVRNHYAVANDRSQRAVAGLSCGARQAAVIAKDGTYEYVGLFCPVIQKGQLPPKDIQPAQYWIGVTDGDVFLYKGRRFWKRCDNRDIPVELYQTKGSHNWKIWPQMFEIFVTKYFSVDAPQAQQHADSIQ